MKYVLRFFSANISEQKSSNWCADDERQNANTQNAFIFLAPGHICPAKSGFWARRRGRDFFQIFPQKMSQVYMISCWKVHFDDFFRQGFCIRHGIMWNAQNTWTARETHAKMQSTWNMRNSNLRWSLVPWKRLCHRICSPHVKIRSKSASTCVCHIPS